jgi:hypothetical protein
MLQLAGWPEISDSQTAVRGNGDRVHRTPQVRAGHAASPSHTPFHGTALAASREILDYRQKTGSDA